MAEPFSLDKLPNEIISIILSNVPLGDDLFNLIRASRLFLGQWRARKRVLLPVTFATALGSATSDAITSLALGNLPWGQLMKGVEKALVEYYEMRSNTSHTTNRQLLANQPPDIMLSLIKFHRTSVEPLIPVFIAWASNNFDRQQTQSSASSAAAQCGTLNLTSHLATVAERSRITAALYQYHIVCALYRLNHREGEFASGETDFVPFYACLCAQLQGWEIEQVLTIEMFLYDLAESIWKWYQGAPAETVTTIRLPGSRLEEWVSFVRSREVFLPRGLSPISFVVSALPESFDFDGIVSEPFRIPRWSSTNRIPVYNKEHAITALGAIVPDLEAPAGWAYNPQSQRLPASLPKDDPEFWDIWFNTSTRRQIGLVPRCWGYIFWDEGRIKASGGDRMLKSYSWKKRVCCGNR
ncbi:hypothetical protein QBC44DRAFT_375686 [Cladorrhinum sp. PSN332]|nr:hypothetical protein QBC44DRAFT_375686 [Cladorrhinum sp. PSN332]